MKNIRIILAAIAIAVLLMVIIKGVRGLIVNIKSEDYFYVKFADLAKDPLQYKDFTVRVDSVYVHNVQANANEPFKILPIGGSFVPDAELGKQTFRFFVKSDAKDKLLAGKDEPQTLFGIFRSMDESTGSALTVQDDPYVIDTYKKARAWYWNIMLILLPQIFIYLLANAIYSIVQKQKTKI